MIKKQRKLRKARIRGKIVGTANRPRLCVFRSNKSIYAQIVDDEKNKTVASMNEKLAKASGSKSEKATIVGEELAKMASKKKIKEVLFDRGGYRYHGRVKALAEGARKGGLKF